MHHNELHEGVLKSKAQILAWLGQHGAWTDPAAPAALDGMMMAAQYLMDASQQLSDLTGLCRLAEHISYKQRTIEREGINPI